MEFNIQLAQRTAAEWAAENPELLDGQVAFTSDAVIPGDYKKGPGLWNDLPHVLEALKASIPATDISGKADKPEAFTALTPGASVTWNTQSQYQNNKTLLLTANTALTLSNLVNAAEGTLIVTQDATGSRTLTPTNTSLPAGALSINTAANGKTMLGWKYDGTTIYWTSKNY